MVCQPSYPLNSANASPFGTLRVYLSWADIALPPTTTASTTATVTISQDKILVMAHFLRCDFQVKFSGVRLRGAAACDMQFPHSSLTARKKCVTRCCHNQFARGISGSVMLDLTPTG